MRAPDPGRGELGPEGDDYQEPNGRYPLDKEVEQLARSGVAPMYVLEDHQDRLPYGQTLGLGNQRLERLSFRFCGVRLSAGYRSPLGIDSKSANRWCDLADIIGRLREYRLQLGEPLLGSILSTKACCPFELCNSGI